MANKFKINPVLVSHTTPLDPTIKYRKLSAKTRFRLHQIARMTIQNIPDQEIALLLGYVSQTSISQLRTTPEYKVIFQSVVSGYTNEIDLEVADSVKSIKEEVRSRIPQALTTLFDALNAKSVDTRLKAVDKIFALDGRLAKDERGNGNVNVFSLGDKDTGIADAIAAVQNQNKVTKK